MQNKHITASNAVAEAARRQQVKARHLRRLPQWPHTIDMCKAAAVRLGLPALRAKALRADWLAYVLPALRAMRSSRRARQIVKRHTA